MVGKLTLQRPRHSWSVMSHRPVMKHASSKRQKQTPSFPHKKLEGLFSEQAFAGIFLMDDVLTNVAPIGGKPISERVARLSSARTDR